jgi:hypothetical protein
VSKFSFFLFFPLFLKIFLAKGKNLKKIEKRGGEKPFSQELPLSFKCNEAHKKRTKKEEQRGN